MRQRLERIINRILLTCLIIVMYCLIWVVLERIIEGVVTNRLVDNIMMLLFTPVIYLATGKIVKK